MAIDPATILTSLPKPGGREAVLLRRVGGRVEVTLAETWPGKRPRALRSIGIAPEILDGFVAAVGSLRTGGAPSDAPLPLPHAAGVPGRRGEGRRP